MKALAHLAFRPAEACPNQCSNHGSCPQTTSCVCASGFTGAYCESMTAPLMAGQAQVGYAGDNSWNYFHFNAFSADNMVVQVNQTSTPPSPPPCACDRSSSRQVPRAIAICT